MISQDIIVLLIKMIFFFQKLKLFQILEEAKEKKKVENPQYIILIR